MFKKKKNERSLLFAALLTSHSYINLKYSSFSSKHVTQTALSYHQLSSCLLYAPVFLKTGMVYETVFPWKQI